MLQLQIGDTQAVNDRVEQLRPRLFAKAVGKLRNVAEAEDAVQETCKLAWEKRNSLRDPNLFDAWVFAILGNVLRGRYRSRANQVEVHSLDDEEIAGNIPTVLPEIQTMHRQQHARILIDRLLERLPPTLAEYVRDTLREGYDHTIAADLTPVEKHRRRRNQERLKEWIWNAVGMESELSFLRRVDNFVSGPSPETSSDLLSAAGEADQLNFAHVVLTLYHLGVAEGLSHRLEWRRQGASGSIADARSMADGVLLHAKLALESALVIQDPYFQGTAHELMAAALFGQAACRDDDADASPSDELLGVLQASADAWGTAATCYAETGAKEAMAVASRAREIILRNIGDGPQGCQVGV